MAVRGLSVAAMLLLTRVLAEQGVAIDAATTVPMLLVDGHPVIKVMVNGRGPYQMVLDTAADTTVVNPQWVGGRTEQVATELRIGARVYSDFAAWSFLLPPRFPKGVLSAEAFPGELVTLDFPRKTVTFQRGALPPADGRRVFQYDDARRPTVPIRMGGHEMFVRLDSGSSNGLTLPLRLSQETPLAGQLVPAGKAGIITPDGEAKDVPQFIAPVSGAVELGEYTLDCPKVRFSDLVAESWPGYLGDEILRTFRLTIDSTNRRLLFER